MGIHRLWLLIFQLNWAIHKITDPNHNFVEYIYVTNPYSGSYLLGDTRLSSINYGHEENGITQTIASIDFEYDILSNMPQMYISGMEIRNRNCLRKIIVKGRNSQVLETYDLSYTGVTLMEMVFRIHCLNSN